MGYINISKHQAANLEFVTSKEVIRSTRTGAYSSTTIVRCNTRKYHGLLVCPQPQLDKDNHVLLSCIDETIEQMGESFNLAVHRYKGGFFYPKGHKYLREISFDPMPKITFNVGGVVFSKEFMYLGGKDSLIVKYTLEEANHETTLHIKPMLAYRNVHQLSKKNNDVNASYEEVDFGLKICMYEGYSPLHFQTSQKADFQYTPHWNEDLEYWEDIKRGYEGHEDLFVYGSFELKMKKGDSVYFYSGIEKMEKPNTDLKKLFEHEKKSRIPRGNFENCLKNAAQQFFVKKDNHFNITAGFPWYGNIDRDTFIALPDLTSSTDNLDFFEKVMQKVLADWKAEKHEYTTFDAPLWLFWTVQQYAKHSQKYAEVWGKYESTFKRILNDYKKGTSLNIKMNDNGLISGGVHGKAVTWMNVIAEGQAVTPRIGYPVEVNALWYNAIMFALELAEKAKDTKFIAEWQPIAEKIPEAFKEMFWHKERGYLADCCTETSKDWSVRVNQVIAVGLPYSPLSTKICQLVLEKAKRELLTSRGLRTLTPESPDYQRRYKGNQYQRDIATHQGTIAVWTLLFYADAYLAVYGEKGLEHLKNIYADFEEAIQDRCIGSIGEFYDADPPRYSRGAISMATSVAALLHLGEIVKNSDK
jgi:predicted glycogen debranching enzyme